jgi:hypothetical protein
MNKPAISGISLFNADTDKVIAGYTQLDDGDTLDLAKVGTRNIAIVANTGGAQSVMFRFNGEQSIDDAKPYASFGDRNSRDLKGMMLQPGTYSVEATAFSANGAAGAASGTLSMKFNVRDSSNTPSSVKLPPAVKALQLQDARTGRVIRGYENITAATKIRLSKLPTRSLRIAAVTSSTTGSVQFVTFGKSSTQNERPFRSDTFQASRGKKLFVQATAYDDDNLSGAKGNTLGFTIRFV